MLAEGICPLHGPKSVFLIFFLRGGGAFTLSLVDTVVGSVSGVVLEVLYVSLQMQVAGPSEVDVTNMFIKAVGVVGVSFTSTSLDRQSAAFL